jgi:hypothetical protein
LFAIPAQAQDAEPGKERKYKFELHGSAGPMYSIFRERLIPPGGRKNTFGYQAVLRAMWHPDHLLAVGILTGHQLIASEQFVLDDEFGRTQVRAWLSATPIMLDVSMQRSGMELGFAIGPFIMRSVIEDISRAEGTRVELGTIGHVSYHRPLTPQLSLGGELSITYLSYRGILSFVPRLDLRYDISY